MNKRYHLLALIGLFTFFTSCNKDDDDPTPSVENLSGYWELDEVLEDGDEADFDDYEQSLESMFVYLGEDDFVTLIRIYAQPVITDGEWELDGSELSIAFDNGEDVEFEVTGIAGEELRVTDDDFTLVFKRIEEREFPDRRCTATVDNVAFVAEEVISEVDGDLVAIGGFEDINDDEDIIIAFEFDFDDVEEGETYDLTDPEVITYYLDNFEQAQIMSGEITFEILTEDQVVATFEFEAEFAGGEEVTVRNGVIKVPIDL